MLFHLWWKKMKRGWIEICVWMGCCSFIFFFLIGGHVVSVLLWALGESSHKVCRSHAMPWFWVEAGLALTTLALTHGHLDFILFCYQSFGFGHTSCLFALGLSSCEYTSYQWAPGLHWLDFVTEKGVTLLFNTGFIGPSKGCVHDIARNYCMAVLLAELSQVHDI